MREDLYEQCSDHMTEKIPSSAKLGSRPSNSFIRSNSCCVRLWAAITSGVIIRTFSTLGFHSVSPRSGRKHKAWGASPRNIKHKNDGARETGGSCRPLRGLIAFLNLDPGACAPGF